MLFSMFGSGSQGLSANVRVASFVVYGVIGVAFFQFGVSIAQERESHWERYRRTLPDAVMPRLVSQVLTAMVFALLTAILVIAAAHLVSAPSLTVPQLLSLLAATLLVAVPFVFLGIALGYWTNAKSAVAVANLLYLPLAYLGGLWMPPHLLPAGIAGISIYTPTRQAGEIVWAIAGGHAVPLTSVICLAAFTVIFAGLAYLGYQRDEKQRYG